MFPEATPSVIPDTGGVAALYEIAGHGFVNATSSAIVEDMKNGKEGTQRRRCPASITGGRWSGRPATCSLRALAEAAGIKAKEREDGLDRLKVR